MWRARDLHWNKAAAGSAVVAIKMLHSKAPRGTRAASRLQHEFQYAKKLSHPNILRVLDLQSDNDRSFIVMELIEGKPLSALLRERSSLREPVVRKILQECADALIHAHDHEVVHGDFKPGNVFVKADGSVKIVDFGAAATSRNAQDAGSPAPDTANDDPARIAAATPAYASPEVLEGQLPGRRDDVFSFACVAYELLALQHPFEHGRSTDARDTGWIPPRAWSLSAPQWLALLSALSWQREQRTADVGTLLKALMAQPPEPVNPLPLDAPEIRRERLRTPAVKLAKKPLSDDFMRPDRGWRYFLIALIALIVLLIALR